MTNKAGIYLILNNVTKKGYIGSATDINRRIKHHRYDLRNNAHHCVPLQRAFNKYGEEVFKFKVLELCKSDKLLDREGYYLNKYKMHLYNIGLFPQATRRLTDEDYQNIRDLYIQGTLQRYIAIEYGVHQATVSKICDDQKRPRTTLRTKVRIQHMHAIGHRQYTIASMLNVNQSTISRVLSAAR